MLRKPHMRNHHIVCCSLSATIYNPGQKGRVVFGVELNYSEFGYVCEKVMTGFGAYFCYAISKTICLEFSEFRNTIPSFKNCENQDDSQKAFEKELFS